jgi:pilus assembly protein CpaB
MSMRKIILLSLALLIGGGIFLVFRSSEPPPAPMAEVKIETTEILAAARDLPTGTILKETDMKWISWAATADTSKLFVKGKTDMSSLTGAVLREGLRTDEPFIAGHVVQPHEHGFLAAVLNPGMRAISVTLTPSAEVAGFIFPGDRVDVILSHGFSRKDVSDLFERHVSETVLTNVRVLALDQKSDNQSVEPKVATTATLEVTPKQAEKIALAADIVNSSSGSGKGAITLALRSLATEEEAEAPIPSSSPARSGIGPTWDSDISSAYPTVNGDDGLMQKVQVMRGKDKTESTFERHH